jgi:hypothetical protein
MQVAADALKRDSGISNACRGAKNRLNVALQEKGHRGVFCKGVVRNTSDVLSNNFMKFPLGGGQQPLEVSCEGQNMVFLAS